MNDVNVEELKNHVLSIKRIVKLPKEIQDIIIQKTSFLPESAKFGIRKFSILNDIKEMPLCPICKNPVRFDKYFKVLCEKCEGTEEGKKAKQKRYEETFAKNHNGCTNPYQLEKTKETTKNTFRKNYDADHYMKSEKGKNDLKKVFEDKYGKGIVNPWQIPKVKEDIVQKNLKNYKVKCVLQLPENRKKLNEVLATQEHKDKKKQICIDKYGVDSTLQLPHVRKRTIEVTSSQEIKDKIKISRRKSYWNIFVKLLKIKNIEPLFDKEYYCNLENKSYKYKCLECNDNFEIEYHHPQNIYCYKHASGSEPEFEIGEFVKSLGVEIECNKLIQINDESNKCHELDILVSKFNFGIEHDGLLWHSFNRKDYHINRTLFFKEKGIDIIHIFGNEWISKRQIVESIIKVKLNKYDSKIFARECEIKETKLELSKEFLETNHLQGYTPSKYYIGLFYNNELVQLLTFGKSRFNKNYEYELLRSCSKLNTIVVGGFERLLNYFEKTYNPKSIITYSDLRYFNGNSYLKAGFVFSHRTEPDYFYFKDWKSHNCILYHRTLFQKHKLASKLEMFDPNKSEFENMIDNGYLRIYDCGNNVFIKQYENEKGETKCMESKS